MKFSAREDIEAPIEEVFASLCEFETFERQAMRRGADVQRVDTMKEPGVGMTWNAEFTMRGRRRKMTLTLVHFDPPNAMRVAAKSPNMEGAFDIELLALSRNRTRMAIALELYPLNLAARLLVQSLKLAKASLSKRFKQRLTDYRKTLENRLERSA